MNVFLDLFLTFFKIGLFTFGGGASMIPLIQQEVTSHGWLTEEQLLDYIAISESTPGPIAINMATFIGSQTTMGIAGGFFGALVATLGVVLPSFIIILIIAMFFRKFAQYAGVKSVLISIRPIVVGMILAAGAYLVMAAVGFKSVYAAGFDWRALTVVGVLAVIMTGYKLITKKSIPVIAFILTAAGVGLVTYLLTIIV